LLLNTYSKDVYPHEAQDASDMASGESGVNEDNNNVSLIAMNMIACKGLSYLILSYLIL
jgi:hypothetical protein